MRIANGTVILTNGQDVKDVITKACEGLPYKMVLQVRQGANGPTAHLGLEDEYYKRNEDPAKQTEKVLSGLEAMSRTGRALLAAGCQTTQLTPHTFRKDRGSNELKPSLGIWLNPESRTSTTTSTTPAVDQAQELENETAKFLDAGGDASFLGTLNSSTPVALAQVRHAIRNLKTAAIETAAEAADQGEVPVITEM